MIADPIAGLLDRLASAEAGEAWREFLRDYSALILHVVRRRESADSRVTDCFLFVCDRLCDDDFRRLRAYRVGAPTRFQTWLAAVVCNLCIDWRRNTDGRVRPPRFVSRLSELEQQVFRHIFIRGLPRLECLQILKPRFPELTDARLADINARLFELLTSTQRYRLSLRAAGGPADVTGPIYEEACSTTVDPAPDPAESIEQSDMLERLGSMLAKLPADQRLLLRLRFEQGLTLDQVARLTGEPDLFRARRKVQAALNALAALMNG